MSPADTTVQLGAQMVWQKQPALQLPQLSTQQLPRIMSNGCHEGLAPHRSTSTCANAPGELMPSRSTRPPSAVASHDPLLNASIGWKSCRRPGQLTSRRGAQHLDVEIMRDICENLDQHVWLVALLSPAMHLGANVVYVPCAMSQSVSVLLQICSRVGGRDADHGEAVLTGKCPCTASSFTIVWCWPSQKPPGTAMETCGSALSLPCLSSNFWCLVK